MIIIVGIILTVSLIMLCSRLSTIESKINALSEQHKVLWDQKN